MDEIEIQRIRLEGGEMKKLEPNCQDYPDQAR